MTMTLLDNIEEDEDKNPLSIIKDDKNDEEEEEEEDDEEESKV